MKMTQNKHYKNIGKKDMINVISQLIRKVEALEMTVNLLVKFIDKEEDFLKFMQDKLGGTNDSRTNEHDNIGRDTPENKSSS